SVASPRRTTSNSRTLARPGPPARAGNDGARPGRPGAADRFRTELEQSAVGGLVGHRDSVDEAGELTRADRVAQLAHRLGLDLAHALARDAEDPADLLEGVGVAVADAVAQLDDLALAEGQRAE